jgi:hypothetical protein
MTKATQAPACGYSADTEILTRHQGWVTFDQLTCFDEVATRSAEGLFEWQHPEQVSWQRYAGEMVRFYGRSMDLLVAPGQRVLWSPDPRTPERGSPASTILERVPRLTRVRASAYFRPTSTWDAPDLVEKVFPGIRRTKMGPKPRDVRMTGDQFAAFMGMYIAEGSATPAANGNFIIAIAQSPGGKGYDEYRCLLTDLLGHEPGCTGHAWAFRSQAVYAYLRPLGKAASKWLPEEVRNLSRRQLGIFWQYYFLGDGSYERHAEAAHSVAAATASPILAGQLQEIIQKLGWVSSARKYQYKPTALVPRSGPVYKLRIRKAAMPSCGVVGMPYSGTVGNVKVPNGAIYVRRAGHPAWCGAA